MQLDDRICYCYDVTLRKLVNFSRRVKPQQPTRMSECLGAGTGCGWCIPVLIKIAADPDHFEFLDLTPEQYAELRKAYIKTQPKNTFSAEEKDLSGAARSEPASDACTERNGRFPGLPKGRTAGDPIRPDSCT
ncbi:MAG: hypothetical protein AABZ47_07310 [Planctomycetota bacterium]